MNRPEIAIVGAGITGLTAGYHLVDRGIDVTIFEARDSAGGVIRSDEVDGYLLERGPHTILERNWATTELIDDLGLDDERVVADEDADRRFVVRNGEPHPVPMSFGEFLDSRLLSTAAKLRLLEEPFTPPRDDDIDESLANFVRRRLGPEALRYGVGPLVAGIYAGSPRRLSARHAFERMWRLERDYGSLTFGMVGRLLDRLGDDEPAPPRQLVSFRRGSQRLVERLGEELEGHIRYGNEVAELVQRRDGRWRVEPREATAPEESFDAVVSTVPAPNLAELDIRSDTGRTAHLETVPDVPYAPVAIVAIGAERHQVDHPLDGFGFLMPRSEPYRMLGTLFMSSIFPERAPAGRILLSSFVGGMREPEQVDRDDDQLVRDVHHDLREIIGFRGKPDFVDVYRWKGAIPQYEVGYGHLFDELDRLERRFAGLHVAGALRNGVAVPDLVEAGRDTADDLLSTLESSHASPTTNR